MVSQQPFQHCTPLLQWEFFFGCGSECDVPVTLRRRRKSETQIAYLNQAYIAIRAIGPYIIMHSPLASCPLVAFD